MRLHPSALPLLFAALLLGTLATSCQPPDPVLQELPTSATILLDFSDPNTRHDGTGGFRYHYEGESYLATYHAWTRWNCEAGPTFFAAFDDRDTTVWIGHCSPELHLESVTAQTSDGTPLPVHSPTLLPDAHIPTYKFQLHADNVADIRNYVTTLTLNFTY